MKMQRGIIIFATLFMFAACSPKLRSVINNPQEPLGTHEMVLVLGIQDPFENDGIDIGVLISSDNGFSTNCSYYEVIEHLKNLARENGANIVKITEHAVPDRLSSCDRISANIYKVPNFRKHEKEVEWNEKRKLTWEDFKGKQKIVSNNGVGAQSYCGFGFQSNYVTAFSKTKIFVRTTFDCDLSWVREDQINNAELLNHEQFHFNLSELYARQLRKRFAEVEINAFNLNVQANTIFKQVYTEYLERQEAYDYETNHGLDQEKQNEWQFTIENELAALSLYTE
ncbi:DUF922 domain-containing protein [Catalinimonas niigatensis]|uniref:DUF922 domain-containing protein n=1 Tax=Catalinimonas niigatensis TaxID=1397264 RepID=UPI0026662F49|nr:DUF922 domain-containing protein [Catalinimonas niigatensis]WPP49343.1 DUF922 domain-containing protein [Catalinimonas niigatensis]